LRYCRRAIAHGETLNDVRLRIIGLWRMGITYIQQGDADRGVGCCNQALGLGPSPYDAATARAARGYGEIKAGRIEEGISDLADAVAWLEHSGLRYPRWRFSFFLAEGHLRRGDRTAARALVEGILEPSRAMGYLPFEGLACWLMGECLAPEDPAAAEPYIATAVEILGQISARNDLARAMMTRAALRQTAGDPAAARELLDGAEAIFKAIGSLDEPVRVETARAALDRGAPIPLLATAS
jgi:tetratricopeptide (TPR) repeat protein